MFSGFKVSDGCKGWEMRGSKVGFLGLVRGVGSRDDRGVKLRV